MREVEVDCEAVELCRGCRVREACGISRAIGNVPPKDCHTWEKLRKALLKAEGASDGLLGKE